MVCNIEKQYPILLPQISSIIFHSRIKHSLEFHPEYLRIIFLWLIGKKMIKYVNIIDICTILYLNLLHTQKRPFKQEYTIKKGK